MARLLAAGLSLLAALLVCLPGAVGGAAVARQAAERDPTNKEKRLRKVAQEKEKRHEKKERKVELHMQSKESQDKVHNERKAERMKALEEERRRRRKAQGLDDEAQAQE